MIVSQIGTHFVIVCLDYQYTLYFSVVPLIEGHRKIGGINFRLF